MLFSLLVSPLKSDLSSGNADADVIDADVTKKPGPGAHSPEKVVANKPRAPQYSLGSKHSEYITPLIIDVPD